MWQQDEEACHLADFGEASHTCTVAAICASHINFRFQGIPTKQQMAATAPLAHRWRSRRLPRSFTYLHGCRNLCIPHQLPIPRNSEDATHGSNRASGPSLAISPTSEKLDSHTCTVAAICASHIKFRFQGIPRKQQMAATAPLANRCPSRRLPRSFTYLHGCRNLCISHQLPIPRNSEEATDGSNAPLAHRWRSRRLPRSLIHIPARLPQSVHPTSTSDSKEVRGRNRWQQPRLWPIAGNLADFREA